MKPSLWDQILNKAKAIAAFLGALTSFAVTLTPLPDWVGVLAALLTFAATYAIPNRPLPTQARRALIEPDTPHSFTLSNTTHETATAGPEADGKPSAN
jgi:hypothetical protein